MDETKTFTLNNDLKLHVRLLEKSDKEALQDGFNQLSDKTKRFRFLSTPQELSNKELQYLTNIDNKNHLAVCAYIKVDGKDIGVGVARYIRLLKDPKKAEIAITIVDKYQQLGIGKILITEIIKHAKQNNIITFEANAFYFNNTIINIINNYTYKITSTEEGVLKIEIKI
jgi:GNAT superfamily N-acetyltransferase